MTDAETLLRDELARRAATVNMPDDLDVRYRSRLAAYRRHRRLRRAGAATAVLVIAASALVAVTRHHDERAPQIITVDTPTTTAHSDTTPTVATCADSDLIAVWGRAGVAAGTLGVPIELTNRSSNDCVLDGVPQLEVLIPGLIARMIDLRIEPSLGTGPVVVKPGAGAQVTVFASNRRNYPNERCPGAQLPEQSVDSRLLFGDRVTAGLGPLPFVDYLCDPAITPFRRLDDRLGTGLRILQSSVPRTNPAMAVVGSSIVVWGGADERGNAQLSGTVFDTQKGTVQPIAPVLTTSNPTAMVSTGTKVLLAGDDLVLYDPKTQQIVAEKRGLGEKNAPLLDFTGTEVLAWFFEVGPRGQGFRIDPGDLTLRPTAAPPVGIEYGSTSTWTGREWVIAPSPDARQLIAYDPAMNTWRTLPDAPIRAASNPVWNGKEIEIYGTALPDTGMLEGAAYRIDTNTWRRIASVPAVQPDAGARVRLAFLRDGSRVLLTGSRLADSAVAVIVSSGDYAFARLAAAPAKGTPLIAVGNEAWFFATNGDLVGVRLI